MLTAHAAAEDVIKHDPNLPTHTQRRFPLSSLLFDDTSISLTAFLHLRCRRGLLVAMQEEARQKAAAITIQSFWRAVRARHLTTIQRAMFKIRQIQGGASKGELSGGVF